MYLRLAMRTGTHPKAAQRVAYAALSDVPHAAVVIQSIMPPAHMTTLRMLWQGYPPREGSPCESMN